MDATTRASHKSECTDEQATEVACLNGGQCFTVPGANGLQEPGCECGDEWTGQRCENTYVNPQLLTTSNMVIGMCVGVFLVILVAVVFTVFYLRKRRQARELQELPGIMGGNNSGNLNPHQGLLERNKPV